MCPLDHEELSGSPLKQQGLYKLLWEHSTPGGCSRVGTQGSAWELRAWSQKCLDVGQFEVSVGMEQISHQDTPPTPSTDIPELSPPRWEQASERNHGWSHGAAQQHRKAARKIAQGCYLSTAGEKGGSLIKLIIINQYRESCLSPGKWLLTPGTWDRKAAHTDRVRN